MKGNTLILMEEADKDSPRCHHCQKPLSEDTVSYFTEDTCQECEDRAADSWYDDLMDDGPTYHYDLEMAKEYEEFDEFDDGYDDYDLDDW